MKVITKLIFMNDDNEKFFGEGPYQLLKKVEETGSLHAGAFELGMAYSKATKLVKNAEESLGFPLTVRKIGGKSGGGSVLTPEAKDFMKRYEAYRDECLKYNERLYKAYFEDKKVHAMKNYAEKEHAIKDYSKEHEGSFGCVIMASGLGKRFGGDKLMATLNEKPMIQYILEVTEGLFASRVVVTRNEKVKRFCEEKQIPVVFHSYPDRNDTIRLGLSYLEEQAVDKKLLGCVFCPADMPFVSNESLRKMISVAAEKCDGIVRMNYQMKCGAPVLFSKKYFQDLKNLPKGKGGSEIIKRNQDKLYLIEAKKEHELWDVDTQEDLALAKNKMKEMKRDI